MGLEGGNLAQELNFPRCPKRSGTFAKVPGNLYQEPWELLGPTGSWNLCEGSQELLGHLDWRIIINLPQRNFLKATGNLRDILDMGLESCSLLPTPEFPGISLTFFRTCNIVAVSSFIVGTSQNGPIGGRDIMLCTCSQVLG